MENNKLLDITEFFSVCADIVYESGKIIEQVYGIEGFQNKLKKEDGPVTEADVKVQALILKGLRTIWPEITVIGEEDTVDETFDFDFASLKKDLVPKDLFKGIPSYTIDLSKAIVWVDPLDGTVEFVKGGLDCVTTLIGISVDNQAKVGVVGKYFTKDDEGKFTWTPKCYFGTVDHPHLYYFDYKNNKKIEEFKDYKNDPSQLTLVVSKNHFTEELNAKVNKINADKTVQFGGAGNKVCNMICGRADCYFYPKSGLKKWDTCATEVLIRILGGVATDPANNPLKYEGDVGTWKWEKGVILTMTPEKHARIMKAYLE